ncbi:hypothetical protein COE95_18305 [Bacillus toyonensis]|nr:hypothetical protein COE95_18305 [Bacillus toyonensis]
MSPMKLNKFLEKLEEPEYYMEIQGYDTRLAVSKINDFIETIGDASIATTYSNKDEHRNSSLTEANIIRRIHIRHAIIDFNNSFDLFLQIPWFFYRMWEPFNEGGKLITDRSLKNSHKIIRNTKGWVEIAEQNCSYSKVIRFLENQTNEDLMNLKNELKIFKNKYIFNKSKYFTIRLLANQMKHNHSLKLEEFYSPFDYTVNINGDILNLRRQELGLKLHVDFYNKDFPDETLGKVKVNYWDDLYIDIEYKSGEKFIAKDYMKENKRYSLDNIYKEMIDYGNSLIELYEKLLHIVKSHLSFNPMIPDNPTKKNRTVNLDKYFKG